MLLLNRPLARNSDRITSLNKQFVSVKVCVFGDRILCCMWTVCTKVFYFQDTVIYERLEGTQRFSDITLTHLEQFATLGLRTLCLAVAEINKDFYEEWKHTYYKASVSLQNRDKKLEEAAELIETVSWHY